jgi:hypothetical protein
MITTIKIESQMDCAYICKRVHDAIVKYQVDNQIQSEDMIDTMVVIDIRKPSSDIDLILKLENKG